MTVGVKATRKTTGYFGNWSGRSLTSVVFQEIGFDIKNDLNFQ